jgi:glycosyltransferase involved in cell wall biosynthesis
MKKFIIIDHSLCSLQGHHYECSISVAEAATRSGYQPIILANRALSRSLLSTEIQIIPVFDVDWFNQPIVIDEEKYNREQLENKEKKPFKEYINYQLYIWNYKYPKWSIFGEKVEGSTKRSKEWLKKDWQLLRSIPLSNTLWGLLKIIWGLIRFIFGLAIKSISEIAKKTGKLSQNPIAKNQSFTETLAEILPTLNLTPEDQVLIHTFGIEQLEELYYFLEKSDRASLPTYHLLFRRDTDEPLVINAKGMGLKRSLQAFYDSQLWPNKIRFYTDTEDLVRKHNALSPVQLSQVPISFRQEKLVDQSSQDVKDFIHIVYLGDARSEKGYQHLPNLIDALWPTYLQLNKVKFTIQSNYNVQGGEVEILAAKLALSQYPENKIKLIDHPISPDDYYQLLASADIVVLPYNPQNYQRTSGVLTEALAAGKPVVVPDGSWLAQQVDETRASIYRDPQDLPQAVIRLLENLPTFTQAAQQFSIQWRSRQSPDYFLDCLLKSAAWSTAQLSTGEIRQPKSVPLPPSVLLILSADLILDGENLDKLNYFSQCDYRVYGIFYSSEKDVNIHSLKQILESYRLYQFWILTDKNDRIDPKDFTSFEYQQYLEDSYYQRSTLLQTWMDASCLQIPAELKQTINNIHIDLVYIDSLIYGQYTKKLGLNTTTIILDVSQLYSYHYALRDRREVSPQELNWEIEKLKQYPVLVTNFEHLAEKLKELTGNSQAYGISDTSKSKTVLNYLALNQACQNILGDKTLAVEQFNTSSKIAILYPWGDIQERQSGASQRTGLLLDYLQKQAFETRVYTIGKPRKIWSEGIYYEYYNSDFGQAELVKNVYQDAYESWRETLNLLGENVDDGLSTLNENWLPWIYYQFRFDPSFKNWIEGITDWADIVILEYPFWGEILGKICSQKNVKLILTAHDVLSYNLDEDSLLRKIALTEEINALKQADAVVTLSQDDQTFFEKYQIKSHCVPIAIDTKKINDVCQKRSTLKNPEELAIANRLNSDFCLFVGSQHNPNIEAVKQIRQWSNSTPSTAETFTGQFVIVGGCWQIEEKGNFISLGKVSDELLTYLYQRAILVLSPLSSGTGMSVKTIEAMAYGKVILGTSVGFRGYPVESGVNCVMCDNLDDYPEKIGHLIQQPEVLNRIGQQAKEFAQDYDYHLLYKTYLDLIL